LSTTTTFSRLVKVFKELMLLFLYKIQSSDKYLVILRHVDNTSLTFNWYSFKDVLRDEYPGYLKQCLFSRPVNVLVFFNLVNVFKVLFQYNKRHLDNYSYSSARSTSLWSGSFYALSKFTFNNSFGRYQQRKEVGFSSHFQCSSWDKISSWSVFKAVSC